MTKHDTSKRQAQPVRERHTRARFATHACAVALGATLASGLVLGPTVPSFAEAQRAAMSAPVSFADVVDKVGPAVVNIQVKSYATSQAVAPGGTPDNMQEFLERFFGQRFPTPNGEQGAPKERLVMGAGSGFAIDAEGHIVTNEHVIHGAEEISVTFQNGLTAKARLVGKDDKTDLALLKIDVDKPVPHVAFGSSDDVRVGDWIVTVGNPFGLGHSVNVGVVSARGRTIGAGPYDDFLQIDAQINRGNSGGPAFDLNGNVIGVNSAIFSPNGGNVGIGFAIPSAMAKRVIADLMDDGVVERGWLGVTIQPVNKDIADGLGRADERGALVAEVSPGGPAAKAGLQPGDLILKVGAQEIDKTRELPRVIADIAPGSTSKLVIWRDGKERSLNVDIGRLPEENKVAEAPSNAVDGEVGLALKELDPETARQMGIEGESQGVVVVDVKPGSPAAETGIRAGDVVVKAAGQSLHTPSELADLMRDARRSGKSSVLALVKRGTSQRFIALPVGNA